MDNGVSKYNTSKASFRGGRLWVVSNFVSNKLRGDTKHLYKSMAYEPSMNV